MYLEKTMCIRDMHIWNGRCMAGVGCINMNTHLVLNWTPCVYWWNLVIFNNVTEFNRVEYGSILGVITTDPSDWWNITNGNGHFHLTNLTPWHGTESFMDVSHANVWDWKANISTNIVHLRDCQCFIIWSNTLNESVACQNNFIYINPDVSSSHVDPI